MSVKKSETTFSIPAAIWACPILTEIEKTIVTFICRTSNSYAEPEPRTGCTLSNTALATKFRCADKRVTSAIAKMQWLDFVSSRIDDRKSKRNKHGEKEYTQKRYLQTSIPILAKAYGQIAMDYIWHFSNEMYVIINYFDHHIQNAYKSQEGRLNWEHLWIRAHYTLYTPDLIKEDVKNWNTYDSVILNSGLEELEKTGEEYQLTSLAMKNLKFKYRVDDAELSKISNIPLGKIDYIDKKYMEPDRDGLHLSNKINELEKCIDNSVYPSTSESSTHTPQKRLAYNTYKLKTYKPKTFNSTSLNSVLPNADKGLDSSDGFRETNPQQTRKRKRNIPAPDSNQNSNQIDKSSKLQRSPAPESSQNSNQSNNDEKHSASRKRENEQALASTQTDRNIARNDSDSFDESNSVKVAESDSDPVSESNTMSSKLKKKQAEKKTKLRPAKKSKTPELSDDPRYMEKYKVEIRLFNHWMKIRPDNFWKPKSIKFCAKNNPVHTSISALNKMITGRLYSKEEAESKLNGVPAEAYSRKYQPVEIEQGMSALIENIKPGMRFSNQSEWIRKKNLAQLIKDDFADKRSYLIQSIYHGASIKETVLNGLSEDEVTAFEIWNTFFKKTKKVQSLQLKDQQSIISWIKDIKEYSEQKVSYLAKCMIAPFNKNSNELYEYVLNVKDFQLNGAATANAFKPNGKLFPIVDEAYKHVFNQSFFEYTALKIVKVKKEKQLSREDIIARSIYAYAAEKMMSYGGELPEKSGEYVGWYWSDDEIYYGVITLSMKDLKVNFYNLDEEDMIAEHIRSVDIHDIKCVEKTVSKQWSSFWVEQQFEELFNSD